MSQLDDSHSERVRVFYSAPTVCMKDRGKRAYQCSPFADRKQQQSEDWFRNDIISLSQPKRGSLPKEDTNPKRLPPTAGLSGTEQRFSGPSDVSHGGDPPGSRLVLAFEVLSDAKARAPRRNLWQADLGLPGVGDLFLLFFPGGGTPVPQYCPFSSLFWLRGFPC